MRALLLPSTDANPRRPRPPNVLATKRRTRFRVAFLVAVVGACAASVAAFPAHSLADPPVFTAVPSDKLIEASGPDGANIDFSPPPATDDNGVPDVTCFPRSGDLFPVGVTTVTCSATDFETDEASSSSFRVRVLPHAQERAASGSVRALFYYTPTTNSYGLRVFKNLRLTILRAGEVTFSEPVPRYRGSKLPAFPAGYGESRSLRLQDLDGDGEPELLLDLFWGDAHCCFWTDVYRYDGSSYRLRYHFWGDLPYRLVDVNHDARPEFVNGDDRFAYAFAAFAFSGFPVQLWSYAAGRFVDVTRRYPARIRSDAAHSWREYLQLRRARYETEGAAAAWAADEYLLHKRAFVWRRLTALARAGRLEGNYPPRLFLRRLWLFLARHGY
jgi:hypothetical protein